MIQDRSCKDRDIFLAAHFGQKDRELIPAQPGSQATAAYEPVQAFGKDL